MDFFADPPWWVLFLAIVIGSAIAYRLLKKK